MCKIEDVLWGVTRDDLDKIGEEIMKSLCLHRMFQAHHPEEECSTFRETEKIKQIHSEMIKKTEELFQEISEHGI